MKIWIIFGICVLMLTGCTSAEYQKMQAERDQLLQNYEDLREEHNELKIKTNITDTLLGKWKFLNLEIEESNVSEEIAETKAALYALDLKNFTLEFFEEKGMYNYRGKNGNTEVSGQCHRDHCSVRRRTVSLHSVHQTLWSRNFTTPLRSKFRWQAPRFIRCTGA